MGKFIVIGVLMLLIVLVLWDWCKSCKKVEDFRKKEPKYIHGVSSRASATTKREINRSQPKKEPFMPQIAHNDEVTKWEQEWTGSKYDHSKLRRAAEEAMRIKEQNRCEMNSKIKVGCNNKSEVAENVMQLVCELVDAFKS